MLDRMTFAQRERLIPLRYAEHAMLRMGKERLCWLCLLEWAMLGGKPEDVCHA